MSLPDVTVIIPTRNRCEVLVDAVRAALGQERVSLEVIVVDDGSSDGTASVLSRVDDPRLRVVRQPVSRGVAPARNRALGEAEGEWVAFLDDDDLWAPSWLATGISAARRANAGVAYGARWVLNRHREVVGTMLAADPHALPGSLAQTNALGGPSAVITRTEVARRVGGFDERLSAFADWELWLRVLEVCTAAVVPDPLVAYSVYPDNMHLRDQLSYLAEFGLFVRIVHDCTQTSVRIDEAAFRRWIASEAARAGMRRSAARLWLRSARRERNRSDLLRAVLALVRPAREERIFAAPNWIQVAQRKVK